MILDNYALVAILLEESVEATVNLDGELTVAAC
jgi:hypothetical protein